MIIIGEKINGSIKAVKEAISNRDAKFIQDLAEKQAAAGADYLDICAGPAQGEEKEILGWLVEVVQGAVGTPLCLDSPRPSVLQAVLPRVREKGLINSASGEGDKADMVLSLAAEFGWDVIALTMDDQGIPKDVETRLAIARSLIRKGQEKEIDEGRIYIDPLVIALSTDNRAMLNFIGVLRQVKAEYPAVKTISGLSNISFGMPRRKLINRNFLALALYEGMDAAILDPLDTELRGSILAVRALLGQDRHCHAFASAYRSGLL